MISESEESIPALTVLHQLGEFMNIPVCFDGDLVEVGNFENEDGVAGNAIGFRIRLPSGQVITVHGLNEAQASIVGMYLYKAVEIKLSEVEEW